jgi:Domain of unknown function (DUF1992)
MAEGEAAPGAGEEARRRRWYGYGYAPGHETVVERQIRLAQERGDFDDLPGRGKPLPGLDGPEDENWWVRGYLRREGLSTEPLLPTPLQLRREVERLPATVADLPSEQAVRDVVRELNRRIASWLRAPVGPAVPVTLVDVDAVVARWRVDRAAAAERRHAEIAVARAAQAPPPRRRWWRRRTERKRRWQG